MQMNSHKLFSAYLIITAILCGGLVMLVEVLGSRLIGPFFGVGLFVWTSIITVALLALAGGYVIGGRLADKRSSPSYLFAIIIIAGLFVLVIPFLSRFVLQLCQPMGLRVGTLISTLILFGPSLFVLGFVSPYIVKIATQEFSAIGRTVGRFYALSTLGSCFGTLLTGFFLIPYFGVNNIFFLAGGLLIAIGLGYFILFQKKYPLTPLILLPFFLNAPTGLTSKTLSDGTKVSKVAEIDSYYGSIKILDYSFAEKHIREMLIDGQVQGGTEVKNGKSIYEYPYFLMFLPTALHPEGRKSLTIGVGAGVVPQWYSARGINSDVVDIDPKIVMLAENYFAFNNSGKTYIEDARYFLTRTSNNYDYILLDVFSGDTTPGHVLTQEAMLLIKQHLSPKGVFAANIIGDLAANSFAASSLVKTLASQFDQVEIYPNFAISTNNTIGNYTLVGYNGEKRTLDKSYWRSSDVSNMANNAILTAIAEPYPFVINKDAIILTDDYNPIDFYANKTKEYIRLNILKNTDWDMLL